MSTFFERLFNIGVKQGTKDAWVENEMPKIISGKNHFSSQDATNISTVYTCIKILSDSLSRLPLNVYQKSDLGRLVDKEDYRYSILHYNPNDWTTSQSFFAALEYYRNLKGNSFARIHRYPTTGKVKSLEILKPSEVIGYQKVNGQLYYILYISKDNDGEPVKEVVNAGDILHFKGLSRDGIWGISPIEALRLNLSTTWKGLHTIDTFYENNAVAPKALKSTIPDAARLKMQKEAMKEFKNSFSGPGNAGEIMILPEYTEIQDLSLSLADAEFINTIKFNSNQIAAAYGVPPHLVGNYEASKFNNVEQLQLNFKANTMDSIARIYRQEMEFKLLTQNERLTGRSIEFNFMAFVQTDAKTRFEGYKTLFNLGVMTPNEINKLEGLSPYDGGDFHFVPANFIRVEKLDAKSLPPPTDAE